MKEAREFEASDEQEAVRAAARELGIPEEDVTYLVTDPGSKGILGVGSRPTKIVVTLPPEGDDQGLASPTPAEEEIRDFQAQMLGRMRLNLDVKVESSEDHVHVRMSGQDRDMVLQNRAELLEAFQYILNRIYSKRLEGVRILADCDGFRQKKEEELRQIAKRVSERVKLTGVEQQLGLMNPYERRIVHLAVAAEEGVSTESSGEGFMKRVTIMPAR